MPKQINVKLGFEADTSQARKQIADLQKSLDNLLSGSIKQGALTGFDKEVSNAQQSVLKLKTAINNSLNADTGRLDLSKFNTQLNNSGLTLSQLSKDMNGLGSDGQKAFLNLANSIVTAQKPMAESNKLLDNMWTALKNTARWQLSSSLLHGFMGALQGAYGYAQDLNKSLTDIAIVTGRSTDQMAAFAEQANKSAQALSVSTTAYTDAALIYYQQGLSDDEVKARTDITMQMSNVTGESAEHVSSYMTAIWNNFAEGSENLDHFADVITALGAATASSSEEIANGMQQFAAVADTVGLSYEYAATALATVVAQTRQSESTVGNSFRTIFSRLQGLKLGETLEDGTSLNKYSSALATIGVNIKDQNGELKEMDTILNEIGAKWQTLTKDQQVALAQTVGGVRQYTNLIALFDNWDTFQENLEIANNSDGTLQKQADIYAESWEAAQKRVKAAWQAIYQDLINDDFFITILNGLEAILHGVDGLIDALGGLPGVLGGIGVIVTKLFEKQMIGGIQNAQQQLKNFVKINGQSVADIEADAVTEATKITADNMLKDRGFATDYEKAEVDALKVQLDLNGELKKVYSDLNSGQKEYANGLLGINKQWQEIYLNALKTKEAATEAVAAAKKDITNNLIDYKANGGDKQAANNFTKILNSQKAEGFKGFSLNYGNEKSQSGLTLNKAIDTIIQNGGDAEKRLNQLTEQLVKQGKEFGVTANKANAYIEGLYQQKKAIQEVDNIFEKYSENIEDTKKAIAELTSVETKYGMASNDILQLIQQKIQSLGDAWASATDSQKKEIEKQINSLEQLANKYEETRKNPLNSSNFGDGIVKAARGISQLAMGINALKSAWDTIQDPNISGWEKFLALATSLAMGIPAIIGGITTLGGAFASFGLVEAGVTAETMTFSAALSATPVGWILAGIAALVAVWWAFDKAIYTTSERLADANDKLAKSEEALENAENAASEAKNAYEELGQTLDGLEDKHKAIDQLVAGTAEWKEAIAESNAELLTALEASGQLSNAQLSWGAGGRISVKNADELKEGAKQKSLDAEMAAALAHVAVNENKRDVALIESLGAVREAAQAQTEAIHLETGNTADVSDYNKVVKEAAAEFVGKTDEETINVISDYAQKLIDSGFAGQELTQDLIASNRNQLEFLSDISDNQDLLDAIQSAADQISEADKNSDAYKKEVGRIAAEKAGYDTSGLTGSALENFYLNLYNDLESKVNEKWSQMSEKEQLKAFAEGSNGQYKWDGQNLVDAATHEIVNTNKLAQSEIEQLGKTALIQQEAQNQTAENLKQMSQQSLAQMRTDARDKFDANFGEGASQALSGMDDAAFNVALNADLSQFKTVSEAIAYIEKTCKEEHNIPVHVNADDLVNFKGKTEDLQVEVDTLSKFIQQNWQDFDGLSEHLAECKAEADAVAYAMLRFDDAMQDVSKNYKTWKEALDSKDVVATNKAVQELKKTYGNLLDIDGSQLSDDFLQSSENLDKLNTVLNGTEEEAIAAYDQLARLSQIDFMSSLNPQWSNEQITGMLDSVSAAMDALEESLGRPIEVGENISFNGLESNLYAALDAILASTNMTVAEAEDLFSRLGFDAEFIHTPVTATNTSTYQDLNADLVEKSAPVSYPSFTPEGDGVKVVGGTQVNATVQGLHFSPGTTTTLTNEQKASAYALAIKPNSLHKTAGGGVKIKNSPARNLSNGGGGGGSCFAAGTQIILKNFQKNIEDIKPGDLVLSYNEKTHKNEFSRVVQTMIHNVYEKIYNLFVKNDKLVVTGNHRFLVIHNKKQQWMPVEDIEINDFVLLSSGNWCKVSNIDIEKKFLTVYNFEVSNTHNYYVGESHILAHNKGGGGGGSKKKKEEKHKEPTKNVKEPDRYHNIKEKIEDLNTEMDRLNKNKDRAYGKDRIKWMDEEIKKTEEQIKLTDEYIDEIKSYAKIDKEDLEKKLGSFISDADFDENGVLKDYEGLLAKIQGAFDDNVTAALNKATAEYNAAVDKFNASDQGDDATEEFDKAKEAWDKAKETYDKEKETYEERLKSLKQYEDTINLLQEKEQERIDQLNELYDKWLTRTTYKVEISLEMNEDDMNYLQWVYDNLGDSADKAADRISLLSKQMKTAQKDIATYTKGIEELFAQNGMNVDLDKDLDGTQLAQKLDEMIQKMREQGGEPNIQKVIDKMSEYRDGLMDTYDTMRDLADAATENVVNAYDEWNERLQENLDLMDHYDSVIDTIKEIADLLGEDQLGLGDEQAKAYEQAKLDNQRNAAAIAKDNYDAIAKERERVQKLLETSESETEKKHWEEVLKNLQEAENEAMEEYLSRWRDALRQAEENYQASLARNEKAYQKAMSGGMGTLDMLQEQFDRQKELDDLYLDDYEKYKKLGDITSKINKNLANNPSPMIQEKMKDLLDDVNAKMENGADISEGEATILEKRLALLEAEDQLLAARNAKSAVRMTRDNEGNFSYTYTADTSKIEEAQQNYADKFYELLDYEKQYSDETQGNMLKSWQDFINKRNEILEDDMLSEDERNKAMERLQADYDKMVAYYSDELNMVMEEMSRLKTDDWKDMENILGRLLAGPEDFETDLSKTTLGQLTNAWNDPEGMAKSWRDAADTLYTQDADARAAWVAANEETNRRVDTSTKEFAENYKSTLGEVVKASDDVAKSAETMAEEMPKAMNTVLEEAGNFYQQFGSYLDDLIAKIGNIVNAINEMKRNLAGIDPEYQKKILNGSLPESIKNIPGTEVPVSAATGMYTGEWGASGKLAILHQKELVLNEVDTANILKAVDFIRGIPQFSGVLNVNNNVDYSKLAAVGATDLQQQVHIDASFPNVESHTEIELALNNLINSASQYVNRK